MTVSVWRKEDYARKMASRFWTNPLLLTSLLNICLDVLKLNCRLLQKCSLYIKHIPKVVISVSLLLYIFWVKHKFQAGGSGEKGRGRKKPG